jgi:hypothetical protein
MIYYIYEGMKMLDFYYDNVFINRSNYHSRVRPGSHRKLFRKKEEPQ